MAKSNIIKQLANDEISIAVAFNRLLIIASDIGNEELVKWVKYELNGYPDDVNIPEYRECKCDCFTYTGIIGNLKIENAPIILQDIFAENDYATLIKIKVKNGISSMPQEDMYKDCTHLARLVYDKRKIQCFSIRQPIPHHLYKNICGQIKTILIEIMLKLEKEYGNLDSLDIDTSSKSKEEKESINNTIINYIYNDNSVTIGNENKFKDVDVSTGSNNDEQED